MDQPKYILERDAAIEAALIAGRYIRSFDTRHQGIDIREKGVNDLVTLVDKGAQDRIIDFLHRKFPEHKFLAEEDESGVRPNASTDDLWIIDPIDGTTNFIQGVPPFAVSIGLQKKGQMVVGVVYDVSRNELFTAVRGNGLYVNGARQKTSAKSILPESMITTGFPYRSFDHLEAYLEVLAAFMKQARGLRRPGAASVDLAYVACGRFDGFFETGLSPWDVAAGSLLVEEGGGKVTTFREEPAQSAIFGDNILATNGPLHPAMLSTIRPLTECL